MNLNEYKIILGSKSPRRKELLEQIGFKFEILVSDEEEIITSTEPEKVVEELSYQKAANVEKMLLCNNTHSDDPNFNNRYIIIGADTVVACDNKIMGKPKDDVHAKEMLKLLSGNTHQVYTGVTLIIHDENTHTVKTFAKCTYVTMYDITDNEIDDYIATTEPADKAGSYGIQGIGGKFIKGIDGDYNNVVGLPIAEIYQQLK